MARPKPPEKPVQVPFRCPPPLHARLKIYAEVQEISVNAAVLKIVEAALQERGL